MFFLTFALANRALVEMDNRVEAAFLTLRLSKRFKFLFQYMQKKKIVFIYNPISGTTGKKLILSQVESKLDLDQFDYSLQKTNYAGHATLLAKEAVAAGADIVCAIGGDGTVNEVGKALINTETALAIIPCGSGNGLARHLHIPIDPIHAIELINEGSVRKMDYGMIDSHPFFCTCGVGFDAFISQKFAKSKQRGPLAYIENVLVSGLGYNPETYDIDIVDEKEEHTVHKAFLISCANASQYGNNVYIAPQASVRDGLLDVTILEPFTVIDAPQIAIQLFNGTIDQNSRISTFRCKSLTIHRSNPGVIHFDGDPSTADREVAVSIVPKGLLCVCPKKEGVFDVADNIQYTLMEQFGMIQMHSEALIRVNKKTNRKLREKGKSIVKKLKPRK